MNAPGGDERYLELRVGAIILVAIALFVTFVLVLGNYSLSNRKEVEVFFKNPGGVSPGAAVKVAGRKVGSVSEMTFLGQSGPVNPATQKPSVVRLRVSIDEDVYKSLRDDAKFYITTKGVLGDPFMEIDPGLSANSLDHKQPTFGVDPPRLDLFMADAFNLVNSLNELLERNAKNIDTLIGSSARLLGAVERMVDGGVGEGRFERIFDGIDGLVTEAHELVIGARERYVDDPKVVRMLSNMESLSSKMDREIEPLMKDVREALDAVDQVGKTIGPEEQKSLKEALSKLDGIMTKSEKAATGISELVDLIKSGQGTVGQIISDEEIYDDLKELIRDIKRHPWKLIWED